MVTGFVEERCDRNEKKVNRWFWVDGLFAYAEMAGDFETIEDAVVVVKSVDEAVEMQEAEKRCFEFLGSVFDRWEKVLVEQGFKAVFG